MASEASWRSGSAARDEKPGGAGRFAGEKEQSLERLLRSLMQRVEESERRYAEALDELHARLDALSATADAARGDSSGQDAEALERLHDQVSELAKRVVERGETEKGAESSPQHDADDRDNDVGFDDRMPEVAGYEPRQERFSQSAGGSIDESELDEETLDKRLVDMAHQLERSLGISAQAEIEALNAKMDELASRFDAAISKAPTFDSFQQVERQLGEVNSSLGRAESQLGRISFLESQLHTLIEGMERTPERLESTIAGAATEAAQRAVDTVRESAADRLEAIHRDLVAMNERSRETDDRLADTLSAVHQSLKQLVEQVERRVGPKAAEPSAESGAQPSYGSLHAAPAEVHIAKEIAYRRDETSRQPRTNSLRSRLGAAIPDYQPPSGPSGTEEESAQADSDLMPDEPHFGRAARGVPGEHEDFIAAARRAARSAAEAEQRAASRRTPGYAHHGARPGEVKAKRPRSFLMVAAVILLVISAILLYARLKSATEAEPTPPATEQTAPAPAPEASSPVVPNRSTAPARDPDAQENAFLDRPAAPLAAAGYNGPVRVNAPAPVTLGDGTDAPQAAALKETNSVLGGAIAVVIDEPSSGLPQIEGQAAPVPSQLPLPPEALGPHALREQAAAGNPLAQLEIGARFAQGELVERSWPEAAVWFNRAASAGLAPAQYRLAVLYERGQGVTKDLAKAKLWYRRAAEQGHVKAMHNLAVAEPARDGGEPDYDSAASWFAQAAGFGLADSQYNLGILHEHGLGVQKSSVEAYKWFALAAAGGDEGAAKRRDVVKLKLAETELTAAEAAIKAWTPAIAKQEVNEVVLPQAWREGPRSAENDRVYQAQTLLNQLGYDAGPPDGMMGPRTREAIKGFQRRNELEETGELTQSLIERLQALQS